MQVKKDEVRNAILNEAEKEFGEKGFLNASVRKIVKAAGTTIGNFYNYFENKDALFEALVDDEYKGFIYFIENHNKVEKPEFFLQTSDISQWRKVLPQLLQNIMPVFSDRFVLLLESSMGTKYENTRKLVTDLLKEHFVEHMSQLGPSGTEGAMGEIIAEQVLNGIILIIKRYKDEAVRKELLSEYLLIHLMGVMGLLGEWK